MHFRYALMKVHSDVCSWLGYLSAADLELLAQQRLRRAQRNPRLRRRRLQLLRRRLAETAAALTGSSTSWA